MSDGDPFIQYNGEERRKDCTPDADMSRELGGLQARMKAVEDKLKDQNADIKTILTTLSEARGGWKTLLAVAGMAGAMGAVIGKLIPFIPLK